MLKFKVWYQFGNGRNGYQIIKAWTVEDAKKRFNNKNRKETFRIRKVEEVKEG